MGQVGKIDGEGSTIGTKVIIYHCVGEHVYFMKTDDSIAGPAAKVVKTDRFHGNRLFLRFPSTNKLSLIKLVIFIIEVQIRCHMKAYYMWNYIQL